MTAAEKLFSILPHAALLEKHAAKEKVLMPVVIFADERAFKRWAPDEKELSFGEHCRAAAEFMALVSERYKDTVFPVPALLKDKSFERWLKRNPQLLAVFKKQDVQKMPLVRNFWADEQASPSQLPGASFQALSVELTPAHAGAYAMLTVYTPDEKWLETLKRAGVKIVLA